jgi:protein SCO1/2
VDTTPFPVVSTSGRASVPASALVRPRALVRGIWIAASFAALVLCLVGLARWRASGPKPMPVLGDVPTFSVTDQNGATFGNRDVAGKIIVADFIFLRCTEACPTLTSRMKNLGRALEQAEARRGQPLGVHFLSFSLDPEHDTPEELQKFATKWGADGARWSFLTGPLDQMQRVASLGFKVGFTRNDSLGTGAVPSIAHGNWFVLADRRGKIRGYYEVDTGVDTERLVADVLRLADGE